VFYGFFCQEMSGNSGSLEAFRQQVRPEGSLFPIFDQESIGEDRLFEPPVLGHRRVPRPHQRWDRRGNAGNNRVYDRNRINDGNFTDIIISLTILSRANEESRIKSMRLTQS